MLKWKMFLFILTIISCCFLSQQEHYITVTIKEEEEVIKLLSVFLHVQEACRHMALVFFWFASLSIAVCTAQEKIELKVYCMFCFWR